VKQVPLGNSGFALVDDTDYDLLMQFRWRIHRDRWNEYAKRHIRLPNGNRSDQFMHNFLLQVKGIDHIDGNGLNNQRSNLRIATTSQNGANSRPRQSSTSKYKGVSWYEPTEKWLARITINTKRVYLGYFKTEEEAALAYNRAAIEAFGEFAKLNEITND
jgi:hypothetical protein